MPGKYKKVLAINPPSKRPVLRDYYCSTYPKADYYWHPVDLLSVAALLGGRADVKIIDAVAQKLSFKETVSIVEAYKPDAVFALVSALTRDDDLEFLKQCVKDDTCLVLGGEVALDPEFDFEKNSFVDGLLLDFTSREVADFIMGAPPSGRIRTRDYAPAAPLLNETYSIGIMPHETLLKGKYKLPLWRGRFFTLLTDFGCPYACRFCNSGKNSLGFKIRDIDEIAEELAVLKQLGADKLYLKDMTFGADMKHTEAVLGLLSNYDFTLRGYLRANLVTKDFVHHLKNAGFAFAQIGVETPLPEKRKSLQKNISDSGFIDAFHLLRKEGIQAGAHFLVGFSDDSIDTVKNCIAMARRLNAVYCSINIFQNRFGAESLPRQPKLKEMIMSLDAKINMGKYNLDKYLKFMFSS